MPPRRSENLFFATENDARRTENQLAQPPEGPKLTPKIASADAKSSCRRLQRAGRAKSGNGYRVSSKTDPNLATMLTPRHPQPRPLLLFSYQCSFTSFFR